MAGVAGLLPDGLDGEKRQEWSMSQAEARAVKRDVPAKGSVDRVLLEKGYPEHADVRGHGGLARLRCRWVLR